VEELCGAERGWHFGVGGSREGRMIQHEGSQKQHGEGRNGERVGRSNIPEVPAELG